MKYLRTIILAIFFFSTLSLFIGVDHFNSPDENANYIFASQFAQNFTFKVSDPINSEIQNIVHPRSAVVVNQMIVPGSFIGLPLLGGIFGYLLFDNIMLFITPILAVLAIIIWRNVILNIFKNERIADLAALFLMIHPAFWYYTSRVMMHNVGFVAFLIFGLWFVIKQPFKKQYYNWLLSGAMIGSALFFRTSEIIWIFFIVSYLFLIFWKQIRVRNILLFLIPIVLMLTGLGLINKTIYGSFSETGYTVEDDVKSGITSEVVVEKLDIMDSILNYIPLSDYLFPFGIHELNIINNVFDYGFLLYPWMTITTMIGLLLVVRDAKWKHYIIITIGLSIWLGIVYGSWKFNDNPDASIITLGNSYVRYWLPIFVLFSALSAVAVDKMVKFIRGEKNQKIFLALLLTMLILLSAKMVILGDDGLLQTRNNLLENEEKFSLIISNTTENSVIIVDMADKYLWPDRNVIVPLRSEQTYSAIPKMLESMDVYYFGITFPEEDITYLNEIKFRDSKIRISEVLRTGEESLYVFNND